MGRSQTPSEAGDLIARKCLATRMRRLNRVVSRIYDRAFRPIGLTGNQVSILVVLSGSEGSKPAEVCLALHMDKSTLCRNVQLMQKQGWVRSVAAEDARSHRLEVTRTGQGLIEEALPLWRAAQDQAREVLGGAVADQLFQAVDSPVLGGRGAVSRVPDRDSGSERAASPAICRAVDSAVSPEPVIASNESSGKSIFFWE